MKKKSAEKNRAGSYQFRKKVTLGVFCSFRWRAQYG